MPTTVHLPSVHPPSGSPIIGTEFTCPSCHATMAISSSDILNAHTVVYTPTVKNGKPGWIYHCHFCQSSIFIPVARPHQASTKPSLGRCDQCHSALNNLNPGIFVVRRGDQNKTVCGNCKPTLESLGWRVTAQAKGL